MPWVRIPVGPLRGNSDGIVPLIRGRRLPVFPTKTDAPPRVNVGGKGRARLSNQLRCVMRPCVRAIQTLTGPVFDGLQYHHCWLLCQLVDGSARMPTKDVPSCDKLQGAARRRRTGDLRIGILTAIALRNGERPGLKHLSRGRKRKRMRCRY